MIKNSFFLLIALSTPLTAQVRINPIPTGVHGDKVFIFFNGTVDSSYALPGNYANALENLEQRAIDAINAATTSLDVAAYELTSLNIVVAICKAKERGVRVRVIIDDKATPGNNPSLWKTARKLLERYKVPFMSDAGWPVVQDKKNFFSGYRSQMHNKFIIADYLSPDSTDDWVLTGSYNFTITGMVSMQNFIKIQSRSLAAMFTDEFNNMWGSDNVIPDTTKASFHQYKSNANMGVVRDASLPGKLEIYFTPVNKQKTKPNFLQVIADLISKEAQHDVKICAFSFSTNIEIDDAIREKHELRSGFDLKALFEPSLGKQKWSLYRAMTQDASSKRPWNKKAEAYLAVEDRHLHHKYIIIDAENPDANDVPVVITGSLNFSNNANDINDENFLVIRDRLIANQYLQEFYARYNKARRHAEGKTREESDPVDTEGKEELGE